jgi:hypothetical protein
MGMSHAVQNCTQNIDPKNLTTYTNLYTADDKPHAKAGRIVRNSLTVNVIITLY